MTTTTTRQRHLTYDEIHNLLGIPVSRNYAIFLKSKYWYDCKQQVLARDGACTQCGSHQALEVHHTTYEHHRDELNHLGDLVTLCNACHAATHGKTDQRRNGMESLSTIISRSYCPGGE